MNNPKDLPVAQFDEEFDALIDVSGLTTNDEIDERRVRLLDEIGCITDEREASRTELSAAVYQFKRGGKGVGYLRRKELAEIQAMAKAKLSALNATLAELKMLQRRVLKVTHPARASMTRDFQRTLAQFVALYEEEHGEEATHAMLVEANRRTRGGAKALSAALRSFVPTEEVSDA